MNGIVPVVKPRQRVADGRLIGVQGGAQVGQTGVLVPQLCVDEAP